MKISNLIASISMILILISLLIVIPAIDIFRIIISVIWILFQLVALYRDYKKSEKFSGTDIIKVGFLGHLIGGYHYNARLSYWINSILLIFGIFSSFFFFYVWSLFWYHQFGVPIINYTFYPSETTVIVLWSMSCVLNIIAAMVAIPPRKLEGYKMTCRDALYEYMTQNQGKAFSANTLKARVSILGLKFREREYYKEHIKEVLDTMVSSYEKILTMVQNEKLYYFIPPSDNDI